MPIARRNNQTPTGPKNRGANRSARVALDRLFPAIAEQQNNALSVDGHPIILYRKLKSGYGLSCTCCKSKQTPGAALSSLTDQSILASPEVVTDSAGVEIRIGRYGTRKTDLDENTSGLTTEQGAMRINHGTDITDPFIEELDPSSTDVEAGFTGDFDSSILLGTNVSSCSVCMGTGIVGGYAAVGAFRVVLDAQTTWQSLDITPVAESNPVALEALTDSARLQFEITLPVGCTSIDCIRLWDNESLVKSGWQLLIWSGSEWVDAANIIDFCTGLPVTMRLNVSRVRFTHLEVQLNNSAMPIYASWPNVTESQNPTLPENYDSVSLQLSPYLNSVRVGDVVADSTYSKLWVITNVTDRMDRERRVAGWEVSARMVQDYELMHSLMVRRSPHRFTRVQELPTRPVADTYEPYTSGQQTKSR